MQRTTEILDLESKRVSLSKKDMRGSRDKARCLLILNVRSTDKDYHDCMVVSR